MKIFRFIESFGKEMDAFEMLQIKEISKLF